MIVKEYNIADGLPHNTVFHSLKDRDGMMWFGTWYGLSSFDGVKFKRYNTRDNINADIPPHKIQMVVEANDGNLWVKTIDHKLYLFDKNLELYYDAFNAIKANFTVSPKIIKIQRTPDGNLLVLTRDKDFLLLSSRGGGNINVELLYDSEVDKRAYVNKNHFIETSSSLNWIGVDFKIIWAPKAKALRSKPSDFVSTKLLSEMKGEFSTAHFSGGIMWLGDSNGQIFGIDTHSGKVTKHSMQAAGMIQNIVKANANALYVTVASRGVFLIDTKTSQQQLLVPLSATDVVTDAYVDSYDKLWLELNNTNLLYYDPFSLISKRFVLPFGRVNRNVQVQDGKEMGMFFLSTSGELLWFDRERIDLLLLSNQYELRANNTKRAFFSFLLDRDNILWLNSSSMGLARVSFPKQQFRTINIHTNKKTEAGDELAVKTLYEARNGDRWIATRARELHWLDSDGNTKFVFSDNNFSIGNVYHIMEDDKGNYWFSTKGNGLVLAEPDINATFKFRFTRFVALATDRNAISGNDVYYTYQDSKKRIWVATFGTGLNLIQREGQNYVFKHRNNSFSHYPKFGQYMEVRNIVEDKTGRLWVGTSDGLMSFDGNFAQASDIRFETFRNEPSVSNISDNDIYVLFKDAEENVWVSVFGGGLNRLLQYDTEKKLPVFKSYGINEGLKSDVLLSIVEDKAGFLWVATENAISRFDKAKETFRNFDRYDGLSNVQLEEQSVVQLNNGEMWFGTRNGVLSFNPQKIETYNYSYQTMIVDFLVSNRELRSFTDNPILTGSIRYANTIKLKHHQSTFVIEFAALNYYNQNSVSYKYILEGYEDEWHYIGKNRIASYPNIPPGKYLFRVQTLDEANPLLHSERTLEIIILPPWWRTWWAHTIYFVLLLLLAYGVFRGVLFYIKMRNEVYIEHRVSELKIKFFTNISHELRTPLTLISGPIQELKQNQLLDAKGQQYVTLIEKSAKQMLQLVNQILDFRKIQNAKMVLRVSQFDLNNLLMNFQHEFRVLSEENDIAFNFLLNNDEIPVWADHEKIEIVVRNIISNAFKYTKAGGTINISTGLIEGRNACYIKIEDSGVGIPHNKLNDIFERFYQADNKTSSYFPGTGIGLALSKELVQLHHGNISAENRAEGGAIFTVELQLGKEHFNESEVNFYVCDNAPQALVEELQATADENVEATTNAELPTVLVVEDNKDMRALLKMQLEDRYNVYTAADGAEGLRKVNQLHPDIVVTDQMMPEMSGSEMLKQIRSNFDISHIPVIILTAKGSEEAKIKAISLGANAYITKPFNKEYLIARIDQLLSDRKVFREKIWNNSNSNTEQSTESNSYGSYLEKKDLQMLEKIHEVIELNLNNSDFNIDVIAENLGLSRSAFFKKVKSLTGLAPVDLVRDFRLNKSVELLKNTDFTVTEIAYEVGFKEAGYFGKCFRKKFDQTPTEFMNKYRKYN